ncbi:MAG: phosphatase PAP2 family protein [Actinomycetota bacterium]|nr:MAG: PA-phosphatase-like [Actinomycetota bacterium]MDO8949084.1 phosphatase PAP2 family protein [Actinomycetota bacterium]MDP3630573.1 phosphatase PAP2 family protein [Actinomycetota bacterium]
MTIGPRESWRRDTRPGILVVLSGIAIVCFGGLWAMLTFWPRLVAFDHAVSATIRSMANPITDTVAVALTTFGGVTIMTALTIAVCAWFLWRNMRAEAMLLGVTMILGPSLGAIIKPIAGRLRPAIEYARIPQPSSLSFPSGHAIGAFLFFGTLVFLVLTVEERLRLRDKVLISTVCIAFIVAVSLSRVYLGVHYLGDVLGAWLLGGAIMTLTTGAYILKTSDRGSGS